MRRSWVQFPLWPPTPYWLGRCQYNVTGWDRGHGLPTLSRVWQHVKKLSDVSLGTRPRYSLVADEDVKKPTKQAEPALNLLSRATVELLSLSLFAVWGSLMFAFDKIPLASNLISRTSSLQFRIIFGRINWAITVVQCWEKRIRVHYIIHNCGSMLWKKDTSTLHFT